MIKKILLAIIVVGSSLAIPSCSTGSHTVKVVKPRKHWFPYDQKKHRTRKRTKIVRMKS